MLKGSWDLVTSVVNKVTILINTYNPLRPDPPSKDQLSGLFGTCFRGLS